ncbi:hypothetical protein D3C85_1302700 [compost metagenome]
MFILQAIDMLCGKLLFPQRPQWPQCPQGVKDDHHVDALLHHSADQRRQVTEGRHRHGQQRQSHADQHTLARDVAGASGNVQRLDQPIQPIHQQHDTRGLCRSSGTAGPHGHADIGRRQRGGVVDAITDH